MLHNVGDKVIKKISVAPSFFKNRRNLEFSMNVLFSKIQVSKLLVGQGPSSLDGLWRILTFFVLHQI